MEELSNVVEAAKRSPEPKTKLDAIFEESSKSGAVTVRTANVTGVTETSFDRAKDLYKFKSDLTVTHF